MSFPLIFDRKVVRTVHHFDLREKKCCSESRGIIRDNTRSDAEKISALAGPEMKLCDWLILVIGPRTVSVV